MYYINVYDEIATEGFGAIDKIVYVAKKFYIKLKHLLKKMMYSLNRVKLIKIPIEVGRSIEEVYSQCCKIRDNAIQTEDFDISPLNMVYRSKAYIKVFHNISKDSYSENDYMKVGTKDVVSRMKHLEDEIAKDELALFGMGASEDADPSEFSFMENRFAFSQKICTTMILTLKQYFDFGKVTKGNRIIPLGTVIQAEPDLII